MRVGDKIELDILSQTSDGAGRGEIDGLELIVEGAFEGERVRARLDHLNGTRSRGHLALLEVLTPHPSRREASCDNHPGRGGRCTGCLFMPLSVDAQRELKLGMLKRAGLEVGAIHGADEELGYRMSSKRVAFGRPGTMWLGSYRRRSHKAARMDRCLVDHPRLEQAAAQISDACNEQGVVVYDERTGDGDLRYVWLKTDGERVLATLVTAGEQSAAAEGLAQASLDAVDGLAHSVQGGQGNDLRGSAATALRGITQIDVEIEGESVSVGPLGFLQPNPGVAARCYRALVGLDSAQPPAGSRALDLYAGAGVTTRLLSARFPKVTACEANAESAKALGVEPQRAEDCLAGLLADGASVQFVSANPPRAGLKAEVCAQLRELGAERIHIMSCGPAGLARDIAALTAEGPGSYELNEIGAYDTLPQTPHIELVATLVRR